MTQFRHYCLFSALYAPHVGGVEAYTAGLANELARRGHRVTVITSQLASGDPAHETQPNGVDVYRLPCRALLGGRLPLPRRNARYQQLWDELTRSEATPANDCLTRVVVNTRFYGHSLEGARLARQLGAPAVVVEHGSAHLSLGNAALDVLVQAYEHRATTKMRAFGYPFCGVSTAAVDWLRHFGIRGRGVVPNALDGEAFAAADSGRDFRRELGLGASDFVVAFVGRLVPEKGVEALLEAARMMEGERVECAGHAVDDKPVADAERPSSLRGTRDMQGAPDMLPDMPSGDGDENVRNASRCAFVFAGDGPLLAKVQGAEGRVFDVGRLGASDVAALLRCSDVLCLPSRSEGFATALLEAAAMGTTPVVTNVGGVQELGIAEGCGTVLADARPATIAAALAHAATHREECAPQGARLRERALASNGWANSADALEALFDNPKPPNGPSGLEMPKQPDMTPLPDGSDARLEQLHRVLLLMLKDFASICERENLQWFAAFGTAIGALRHGGFVPWDDDIDICMPRADLERLAAVVERDHASRYDMVSACTNPRYPMATTRLMLKGTEFRDAALTGMDFESGIFLDLFPLDDLADDERLFRRQAWRAWLYNKLAIAKLTPHPYIAGTGVRTAVLRVGTAVMRGLLNLPGLRAIDLNARSMAWQTRCKGESTRRIGFLCDTDRFWSVLDREEAFPVRMAPFEDTHIALANRAENLLARLYGDFMTPPPAEARHEHYPDILDFGPYADV